jgi:SEC-C motif-containing protein
VREEWLEDDCPCGEKAAFKDCCDVYISGAKDAPTAEKLMRSRYSAFVVQEPEYVFSTHNPSTRADVNVDEIAAWSQQSQWEGLNIVAVEKGLEADEEGKIEFVAHYHAGKKDHHHHEVSTFHKKEGKWWFTDGAIVNNTYRRDQPKVGRNDPCPCGSGKKFKKCCG